MTAPGDPVAPSNGRPYRERITKAGVLIAPGSSYGMPSHFRVGYGLADPGAFNKALAVMADVLVQAKVPGKSTAASAG